MGKTINEVLLHSIELNHFLIIDKDQHHPNNNQRDEERENKNHHPSLCVEKGIGVHIPLFYKLTKGLIHCEVGVNIEIETGPKGQKTHDKNKERVIDPTILDQSYPF